MSGHDSYPGYNDFVVLLLLLVGLVTTPGLVLYAIIVLFRSRTAGTLAAGLKSATALAWAAAVGMYTWGVLHVLFLDDQQQDLTCRAATGTDHVAGYDPSFIPLQLGCRTADGHTVISSAIPSYINPAVALLVASALVLTGFAIAQRKEKNT